MAPGSQYREENGNGSPKVTRNGGKSGGHLPRSDESKMWDLDGDGGKIEHRAVNN